MERLETRDIIQWDMTHDTHVTKLDHRLHTRPRPSTPLTCTHRLRLPPGTQKEREEEGGGQSRALPVGPDALQIT
jgi:hypothetical protein